MPVVPPLPKIPASCFFDAPNEVKWRGREINRKDVVPSLSRRCRTLPSYRFYRLKHDFPYDSQL